VHPPYFSPDLVAAPVESVVESGQAVLASGAHPMRQKQLNFTIYADEIGICEDSFYSSITFPVVTSTSSARVAPVNCR